MPNDFIGGGSKDAPHSEGERYVSKSASRLIVIITLRASQTIYNDSKIFLHFFLDYKIFCEEEWKRMIKKDGKAIINANN
jgi:hypothetical protein